MEAATALGTLALGLRFHLKSRRSENLRFFSPASSSLADRFIRGLSRAEGSSMSFVAWKILAAKAFADGNSPFYVGCGCACLTAITEMAQRRA